MHFTKPESGGGERRRDANKGRCLHSSQNIKEKLKSRGVITVKCRHAGKSCTGAGLGIQATSTLFAKLLPALLTAFATLWSQQKKKMPDITEILRN